MAERASRTGWCILAGGLAAGALDHLSACASLIPRGISAEHMLQYIASGAIGPRAFSGGAAAAALGLAVHLSLTTLMAAGYVLAARRFASLSRRPWTWGPAYGIATCLIMNYIAVPLSLAPGWKPPAGWDLVQALLAGAFYVGLPIASITAFFMTRHDGLATFPVAAARLDG